MSSEQHFNKQMLDIREKYLQAGNKEPFELRDLAAWAIGNQLYDIPFSDKISRFCADMRRILREETHTAPNGVSVRTFQCVRASIPASDGDGVKQRRLWADVRRASPAFVLSAYNERHKSVRCDVRSLQSDVDTWNECYRPESFPPIQLNWDFSSPHGDEGLSEVG